ncbi:hypothetical protein FO519_000183 [Halicephalobus sp. NKZ332]|nr:hypothetical protein FO519_000183 [Halicephalobus sp. NKZ332]
MKKEIILCIVFCTVIFATRPQIGFYPLKGNMFRGKFSDEIQAKASLQFQDFVRRNNFSKAVSQATNISYWVSEDGISYYGNQFEGDLCVHTIDSVIAGKSKKLKMYFLCDAFCCADECCERDWPLTIV